MASSDEGGPYEPCDLACLSGVVAGPPPPPECRADAQDLGGGVLIAHCPGTTQFSSDPPQGGWCDEYLATAPISECSAQINRIDSSEGSVWFILAAWTEEKEWAGIDFGLGSYDAQAFTFVDHGPCFPGDGLEMPTSGWPGPNEGCAFVTTGDAWTGNYLPVYYFCGYAYQEDLLPISTNPATGTACVSSAGSTPVVVPLDQLGGMGILCDGLYACPRTSLHEVIAMFREGIIGIPYDLGQTSITGANITSAAVESVLVANNVQLIARAFPEFDPADTLGVARTGETVYRVDLREVYSLVCPNAIDAPQLVSDLLAFDDVFYAEASLAPAPERIPNDQFWDSQWSLSLGYHINVSPAWDVTTGVSTTKIAIIDGGVENGHEDLMGKVSGDTGYGDWGDHGTLVAGVAAAHTNNGLGIAGVNWNALLYSQRVDEGGSVDVAEAIRAAVDEGCEVLNNSWGYDGAQGTQTYSATVRAAFADAYKMNCLCPVASGNDAYHGTTYPAAYRQGVIATGATEFNGNLYTASHSGSHLDVTAPGVSILSCTMDWPGYRLATGTSLATPHVSGLAGLLLAIDPTLYNDDLESIIKLSAVHPTGAEWDEHYGTGIINTDNALRLLAAPWDLAHLTAGGGYAYSNTDWTPYRFFGVPGLPQGPLWAKRYEVRKVVTFPSAFLAAPSVWGRGVAMRDGGFSDENWNFGLGWCEPVDGTISATGCALRTYVYYVRDAVGILGWFPCEVGEAHFAYTALGIPSGTAVEENPDSPVLGALALEIKGPTQVRGMTKMLLTVPDGGNASVSVLDVTGREVRSLVRGEAEVGERLLQWDGRDDAGLPLPSGTYFVRAWSGPQTSCVRVTVVR